jgi:leucine dehydrogenase
LNCLFDKFIIKHYKNLHYECSFHNWKGTSKNGSRFGQLSFDDHEQIVFCNDKDTGLKAIIGIHNSVMGPALGGTRMFNYANEWEAK